MTIGAPAPATATFLTGPVTDNQANGSNITINAGGAVSSKGLFATVEIGAGQTLTNGGNITFTGTGSYNATGPDAGMDFQIVNSATGIITTGGNISLRLDGAFVTAGDVRLNLLVDNRRGNIQTGANINATVGTGLGVDRVNLQIDNRGGSIGTGAGITYNGGGTTNIAGSASFTILNSGTAGSITSDALINVTLGTTNIGANLFAFIDNLDGKIGGTGGQVTLQINGALTVTGRIDVFGTLNSTNPITAGTFSATTTNAPGVSAGAGGITRFNFPSEPIAINPTHTITTNALTSTGGINFNGPDLSGGFGPFSGGRLILNVPSLTFGSTAGDNIQGAVTFNGGASTTAATAGDGGIFTVNATGAITVGSPIQATTGIQPFANAPSGAGGTVNLNSTGGSIVVSSPITVSSAETNTVNAPRRRSRSGGNINLRSDAGTAVAINITNTGQLLSLLDAAAPGPGGKITILATASDSGINVNGDPSPVGAATVGTIRADGPGGAVDIRHTGAAGSISLASAQISADIVKVGALGNAGTLTIGGGAINADTILKLYAPGPNGLIHFIATVSLNGNSTKILAANTITIDGGVRVNIGGPTQAQIFTTNANYSGSGGNGSTTGTFTGAGAQNPQPLANAPAFGPPGGP
jgi:hypothetical protein